MKDNEKLILDLCSGTGAWSKPYIDAGYNVIQVTLPKNDVLTFIPPKEVYGIIFAPPCENFAVSGSQYWAEKDRNGTTLVSIKLLLHGLRIIAECKPHFWAIENPVGRLSNLLGRPVMYFHPYYYGDPYTKKTCLWGIFNPPVKKPVTPIQICKQGSWIQKLGGKGEQTKLKRSITPSGFATAFFEANR